MATDARPQNVTIAVAILCVVLFYQLVSAHAHIPHPALASARFKSAAYAVMVLSVCINAVFVYYIFKRRNWARLLYLVFFLIGILLSIPSIIMLVRNPSILGMVELVGGLFGLIGFIAQIVALSLLFTGSGSAWFRGVEA